MSNSSSDGTSSCGVTQFFEKTGRYEARRWEDEFTLSHIDEETGRVKDNISELRSCPICNDSGNSELFNKQGFIHRRCTSCDTIYVSPSLTKESFHELWYGDNSPYPFLDTVNSEDQKRFDRVRFNSVLNVLAEYSEGRRLLDVGTGGGYFLQLASEKGWCAEGVDVYKRAADFACSQGLNVKHADFNQVEYPEAFDCVSLWEVIDLVPNPLEMLDGAIGLLKQGGVLGLSFRNAYSLAAMILREECNVFLGSAHFQMMSFSCVENLLNRKGFELVWSDGYISESRIVCNYLDYLDPYKSDSKNQSLKDIFTDEFIHKNKLSYKFNMVFRKL